MTNPQRSIIELATGQLGAFSRSQAHALGLTDHQLRSRVRSGFLEAIGPNAFRLPGTSSSPESRLVGLMLDVGDPVLVAGPTAAALYRLDGFELMEPFHLVIPRGRNVRRIGSVIHTAQHLPDRDRSVVRGIQTTRPTRTIVDLARIVDRATLTRALDSALRDGLTSVEALLRRVAALEGKGFGRLGIDSLVAVIEGSEIERGGHSFLEREFLRLIDAGGLPRPLCQQVLGRANDRLVRVDFRFPGTRVVVEVLGYRYHRTPTQLSRDAERMNDLITRGYLPFQFSYDHVLNRPDDVLAVLVPALSTAA